MCEFRLEDYHKQQAIKCFNDTWDLIDKKDRTPDEDLKMIHTAHASRYHWGEIGTHVELLRGEWQISRVYSLLNMGHSALMHAQASLRLCAANDVGGFDLAFAYEAMARSYKALEDDDARKNYRDLALKACECIEAEEDRKYVLSEIASI